MEIIPYKQNVDFVDIHTEFDIWISEKLMNDKEIYPNEEYNAKRTLSKI